jgi:hypothetical protein
MSKIFTMIDALLNGELILDIRKKNTLGHN